MADDLELVVRSIEGEGPSPDFVADLRERIVAEITTPAVGSDDESVVVFDLRPEAKERPMTSKRMALAGLAAAAIVVIVGFVALSDAADEDSLATTNEPDDSTTITTTTTTATTQPSTTQAPVVTTGECGLAVASTVAADGNAVTFEVTSDPSCAGETVELEANGSIQGLPILRTLTLDSTGEQSVTDQLVGSRKAAQNWNVQLTLADGDSVAAAGEFTVEGFCDLQASADLQVTHLTETNELNIVLTVDPLCAGTEFAFDREGGIIGTARPGGWDTWTVDENGRIDFTRPLLDPGPFVTIEAMPAGGTIISEVVAQVTLDVSG